MEVADMKPEAMSHPPMDQLLGMEYCIDSNPSWGETVVLGFQHFILCLGTAVMIPTLLVPLMGGNAHDKAKVVQTMLLVTGINTMLQTLFGTRLPTVIGGSYAFVIPVISIISDPSLMQIADDHIRFKMTMRAIQGALIISSCIQIILGYSQLWGLCSRFFSPLGMVPVVALAGLGLFDRGFPVIGRCVEIGLPMLVLFVALSQYLKHVQVRHFPILERFSVLISIALVWVYAHILTASGAYRHSSLLTKINCRTDRANLITTARWFRVPYPLQWGAPTFSADHSFGMMAAVLVSLIESTGAFKAAARLASATPPPPSVLSRGIGWQGIGLLFNGLFGTVSGSTVSVENVGLLGSTRIGSRRVTQISAGFMIFFSVLGKFGALFASIPFTIFAAIYCVLFGYVGAVGLSFLQFTNMNSIRNLFIVGVSLFLGISIPEYFFRFTMAAQQGPAHTRAGWFNDLINTIFSSPPTVGFIVSVVLDNTLEVRNALKDRGMPWWARFRTFRGDSRNEEFYNLPLNLNRLFPPS
ncbi:nucleobase-ascorbate transporter 2-like [Phragmites australis]|uniref:nucleobase-ascorbate transporter 2-like n=1 Tax=Phragmites australis TaxID=29695 RepID=UPI002D78E559|nr:nucleobase-ascorbate transporter 2-like [Phragmites australis]